MYALVVGCVYVGLAVGQRQIPSNNYRYKSSWLRQNRELNLTDAFFGSLRNYEVNGTPVNETKYPWIARVVHSASSHVPHVCTASCIDAAVFITAARCIYSLKVNYTRLLYRSQFLNVLAFVLPSEISKQTFDDIGFIVVHSKNLVGTWSVIQLFTSVNRTDNVFAWFKSLEHSYGKVETKVLGYAVHKGIILSPKSHYSLTELKIIIGLGICSSIFVHSKDKVSPFSVPCYHSCDVQAALSHSELCNNYHGVEGGAIFDTKSNKLIGIATWGTYSPQQELPVGFAFANSETFYKDYTCALKIRNDNGLLVGKGYYQSICDAN